MADSNSETAIASIFPSAAWPTEKTIKTPDPFFSSFGATLNIAIAGAVLLQAEAHYLNLGKAKAGPEVAAIMQHGPTAILLGVDDDEMMAARERKLTECPECHAPGVSPWTAFLASWPFSARCKNCGAALRTKIPTWQNVLVQVIGQVVFWATLLYGISSGWGGAIAGFIVGAVLALLIATIPGYFAKLEVTKKR
jgi:branched-subunit amino acid ABC-type transport system permease component